MDTLAEWIILTVIVSVITFLIISYLSVSVLSGFGYELRSKMFDIYLNANTIDEFNEFKFSGLMARTVRGVYTMQSFFMLIFKKVILIIMIFIGVGIDCFEISLNLGIVYSVLVIIITAVFICKLHPLAVSYFDVKKINGTLNGAFKDKVNGSKFIKLFSKQKYLNDKFEKVAETSYEKGYRFQYKLNFHVYIMIVFYIVVFIAVFYATLKYDNMIYATDGTLILLFSIAYLLTNLKGISKLVAVYPLAYTSSIRIEEVLVIDEDKSHALQKHGWREIEFKNVSLNLSERQILSDISFKIPRGSKTLITGPVASGKTALSYLLMGFHKQTAGEILVDGTDISQKRPDINWASDDYYLLKESVFDNIKLDNNSLSREYAEEICKSVLFEHDLDYSVNEGGNNLTNVAKQKLNIARVLAHDGEIYIFDNAFALFDDNTKRIIHDSIKSRLQDKTVIFIENDFENDLNIDNVISLDNGHMTNSDIYNGKGGVI
jgi:ATP-binding cassette subfamily B protein